MTFHKEDQILYLLAEHDLKALNTSLLRKDFSSEYDRGVYRFTHKQWGDHPHNGQAWFDEKKELLLFTAMTERGFSGLVASFNSFGFDLPEFPFLRVNLTMVTAANEILKKKVVLNEYEDHFQVDPDPEQENMIQDLNAFIALVLPEINAGRTPDIEAAARQTGVDPDTAHSVVESVMDKLDSLPPLKDKPARPQSASPSLPPAVTELPRQDPALGKKLLSKDDELLLDLHLYMLADKIRRLAPWELLYEDEVFGVQLPGTELVYFVSVMGSDGEFLALAFYRGYRGFAEFLDFRENVENNQHMHSSEEEAMLASLRLGGTLAIPHLMLSFLDREELSRESVTAIRKSGAKFRGRGHWPEIQEVVPGHLPKYPGRDNLVDLYLVMQQTLEVLEKVETKGIYFRRANQDPDDGSYPALLVRVPTGKGPRFRWKELFLEVNPDWGRISHEPKLTAGSRKAVAALPEASQELQLELFMLSSPVKEKGIEACFPFVLLVLDKSGGLILNSIILLPHPDLDSMYETVPQKVLDEFQRLGHRPSAVEVRSEVLLDLLNEVLPESGIRVVWEPHMPGMDEAMASFISNMS
jgi:hypothetical protein